VLHSHKTHTVLKHNNNEQENVRDALTGCTTICGRDPYSAPEVRFSKRGHGFAADWWGVGVLIYKLLTGKVCSAVC
jgi:serine/threonine protein kinase